MTPRALTAACAGLVSCHDCGLLARPAKRDTPGHCPRCGEPLAARRPHPIQRTWALLIAAAILYVPANALPVLVTDTLTSDDADTILSGVVFLYQSGSWPLAAVVFFASVMVPLLKIFALVYLAASAQRRSRRRRLQRTRLYRMVEFVGRWSMLDIYVITILVALVKFQGLAIIQAGPAAVAFGAVVVLTMFAAMSFDPRLIWDPAADAATHPQDADHA